MFTPDALIAAVILAFAIGLWIGLAVTSAYAGDTEVDAQTERDMLRLARAVEVIE